MWPVKKAIELQQNLELAKASLLLLATILWLALSGCGAVESDEYGIGDCLRVRGIHEHSDWVVRVVNQTAYKGWIVETLDGNERATIPFNTPMLDKVPCE